MPPVFKPWSPSSARLWSCEVGKQFRRFAVAKRVQRNFHAFQKFLDDNVRARRAEGFADQDFVNGLVRFGDVGANQNAFAERQAVGFHGAFAAERRGKFLRRRHVR